MPTDPRDDPTLSVRWQQVEEPEGVTLEQALASAFPGTSIDPVAATTLVTSLDTGVRRPGVRHRDGTTVMSLRLLELDAERAAVESGESWMLVHGHEVVTVRRRSEAFLAAHGRGSSRPSGVGGVREVRVGTVHDVLQQVLLVAVEGYERVVEGLTAEADEVELSVFASRTGGDAERIYLLKREVAESRRAVLPLVELVEHQVRNDPTLGGWFLLHESADVLERLHRAAEGVEALDALLSTVLDAHVARVSVQQNDDMRRISAGAALIVVPTLLAGIWGMNFRHMPELEWTYGYPAALGVMMLFTFLMWRAFRRSGWL